ncbi:hypothetical protein AALD74_15990 [Lachnospiraceae bacterium 48-21]|nr:hypothetical protein [Dorea sp.]
MKSEWRRCTGRAYMVGESGGLPASQNLWFWLGGQYTYGNIFTSARIHAGAAGFGYGVLQI